MICLEYCSPIPPTSSIKAPDTPLARASSRMANIFTLFPHRPLGRVTGTPVHHLSTRPGLPPPHSDHTAPTSKSDMPDVSTIIPYIALVVILA
ncbi:hypothetical protein ACHAXT_003778 [Thalassiosira profunda]